MKKTITIIIFLLVAISLFCQPKGQIKFSKYEKTKILYIKVPINSHFEMEYNFCEANIKAIYISDGQAWLDCQNKSVINQLFGVKETRYYLPLTEVDNYYYLDLKKYNIYIYNYKIKYNAK